MNGCYQPIDIGFGDVGCRTCGHRFMTMNFVGVARVEDTGHPRRQLIECFAKIETRAVRQTLVENIQIEFGRGSDLAGLFDRSGRLHLIVLVRKKHLQHLRGVEMIIDTQDSTFWFGQRGTSLFACKFEPAPFGKNLGVGTERADYSGEVLPPQSKRLGIST